MNFQYKIEKMNLALRKVKIQLSVCLMKRLAASVCVEGEVRLHILLTAARDAGGRPPHDEPTAFAAHGAWWAPAL
jgi:hypothetical protein